MQAGIARNGRTLVAAITAALMVLSLMFVFTTPADATHVSPTGISGNQNCAAATGLSEILRLEGSELVDGTYSLDVGTGSITIDIADDLTSVDWQIASGDFLVAAVFVKGGSDGNLYDYSGLGGEDSDTGLVPPLNPGGQIPTISHITFCEFVEQPTTTSTTVEETTSTTVEETTSTTVEETTTTTIEDEVLGTTITTAATTTIPDEVLETEVEAEELPFTGVESELLLGMAVLLLMSGLLVLGLTGNREDA